MDSITELQLSNIPASAKPNGPPASPVPDHPLPDEPLILIRPSRGWVPLNLRDLWAYRELLYFLTWRDVKVRYKQTLLGAAWIIIQPLITMITFTLLFRSIAKVPYDDDVVKYPLFVYSGLLLWTFFSRAVSASGNSLLSQAHLITKVYFPRMIVPASTVTACLVDLAVAFPTLICLMLYYGTPLTWSLLAVVPLILVLTLLSLGLGMWISALNVQYRDVGSLVPFAIQMGMFVSPIIYPASMVPEKWRWAFDLNPLTGIIEAFRAVLFGRPLDVLALSFSLAATAVIFISSAYVFRRVEKTIADVI